MENNNYQQAQYQQPVYQTQPQYQPLQNDPAYLKLANEFLTKAIVSGAISSLPVASFVALVMASKNRKKILEYLDQGGYHTFRIKTSSALSRAAKYSAIGFSIFWGIYLAVWLIYALGMLIMLIAAVYGNI